MKRLLAITGTIMIALIVIGSGQRGQEIKAEIPKEAYEPAPVQSEVIRDDELSSDNEQYYYLREYQQRLAVYKGEEKTPFYITDIHISRLPKADQLTITGKGIRAEDKKSLNRLLEDFCS